MLSKVVLIHSCTYALAEIDLSRGGALQLLGGNNVGKSSLICALNFLFVIDRRQMTFSGGREGDQETMEYYFPRAEGSFLVFEVNKRGRAYCIVVWRDVKGDSRYTRLDAAYDRALFLDEEEDGQLQPLALTELRGRWLRQGVQAVDLKDKNSVREVVYGTGRNSSAVVWLKKQGKGNGISQFIQLYRYLIDTRTIDMRALKNILLLADHRGDTVLRYRPADLRDITHLRQNGYRIRQLERHREAFDRLRLTFTRLDGLERDTKELAFRFDRARTCVRAQTEEAQRRQETDRREAESALQTVREQLRQVQSNQGGNVQAQRSLNQNLERLQRQLAEIDALDDRRLTEEALVNLEELADQLTYRLRDQEATGESPTTVADRMTKRKRKLHQLRNQLANQDNWLIHHLAENDTDRRRLIALLKDDISHADASLLLRGITTTEGPVSLFDGTFRMPLDADLPELITPEQLRTEIERLESKQDRDRHRRETSERLEQLREERSTLQRKIEEKKKTLRRHEERPRLAEQLEKGRGGLAELRSAAIQLAEQLAALNTQEDQCREAVQTVTRRIEQREQQLNDMRQMRQRVADLRIDTEGLKAPVNEPKEEDLRRVFEHLLHAHEELRVARHDFDGQFRALRHDLDSDLADPAAFLERVEQDYAGLSDLRASVNSLIDSVTLQFAGPAANLLQEYGKFAAFISKQFNRELNRLRVSNIEQLRIELTPNAELHRNLERISHLNLGKEGLFQPQTAELSVLTSYIETGREIAFSDLFSINLVLTVKGQRRSVDLSRQVESDGTDRMLRLILVMQVISRLVVSDPENKLVIFIDEIATLDNRNRPQLVDFCRDHHFYPIFAAPEAVEGFDRYVTIVPPGREGERIVVEEGKHYFDVERD